MNVSEVHDPVSSPEPVRRSALRLCALVVLLLIILALAVIDWCHPAPLSWIIWAPSPSRVWEVYTEYGNSGDFVPEAFVNDPLILAGEKVAPLVLRKIQASDTPKRGYAVLFLGQIHYKPALPVLQRIVLDAEEEESVRGSALQAITMIDRDRAARLAKSLQRQKDFLGYCAKEILTHPERMKCSRTVWDVLFLRD